jgi:hypothetical protein
MLEAFINTRFTCKNKIESCYNLKAIEKLSMNPLINMILQEKTVFNTVSINIQKNSFFWERKMIKWRNEKEVLSYQIK